MIISYSPKKVNSKQANKLIPGVYMSEIVDVKTPKGYGNEQAFEIEYSLVDTTSGASYKKTEVYYNDLENQRTSAFLSYLANNGVQVETTDDFVGIKETLQFAYITSKGKRFLNITHRDFVSKPATVQPTPQPKTGK